LGTDGESGSAFGLGSSYGPGPDGKRLAAMVADSEGEQLHPHLTVLLNVFDELRRKSPETMYGESPYWALF